jgi:hypothetical protein
MNPNLNRRDFLSHSLMATVGAAVVTSAAEPPGSPNEANPPASAQPMPSRLLKKPLGRRVRARGLQDYLGIRHVL